MGRQRPIKITPNHFDLLGGYLLAHLKWANGDYSPLIVQADAAATNALNVALGRITSVTFFRSAR
jgi:hypothetical protein